MWKMKDAARGEYKKAAVGFYFNNRDRTMDTLTTQPDNEVHVYLDECPVCSNRHIVAHYPAGKILCADFSDTKRNPSLEYTGYRAGVFIFRFRALPVLPRVYVPQEAAS